MAVNPLKRRNMIFLNGVERGDSRKAFLRPIPDQTRDTIIAILREFIDSGSSLVTDCFAAYTGLVEGTFEANLGQSTGRIVPFGKNPLKGFLPPHVIYHWKGYP